MTHTTSSACEIQGPRICGKTPLCIVFPSAIELLIRSGLLSVIAR